MLWVLAEIIRFLPAFPPTPWGLFGKILPVICLLSTDLQGITVILLLKMPGDFVHCNKQPPLHLPNTLKTILLPGNSVVVKMSLH